MTHFILTYDERVKHHDYSRLYQLLADWNAAHLQNSVWLADLDGTAGQVLDDMRVHMHADDTACVIQLPADWCEWATIGARETGNAWLAARWP